LWDDVEADSDRAVGELMEEDVVGVAMGLVGMTCFVRSVAVVFVEESLVGIEYEIEETLDGVSEANKEDIAMLLLD
jgi:hypothetical protein